MAAAAADSAVPVIGWLRSHENGAGTKRSIVIVRFSDKIAPFRFCYYYSMQQPPSIAHRRTLLDCDLQVWRKWMSMQIAERT